MDVDAREAHNIALAALAAVFNSFRTNSVVLAKLWIIYYGQKYTLVKTWKTLR